MRAAKIIQNLIANSTEGNRWNESQRRRRRRRRRQRR
jgi:hypothetical protein